MQHAEHHVHPSTHHLLRASDQYMPGHGLGVHAGQDRHAGHTVAMFRTAFWFCLVLTIPTLIWEPMLQAWIGYQPPAFPGSYLIPAIFGTAVFYYGGQVFIRGAYRELHDHQPGMMVLIALAISVAFIYSAMVTMGFAGHALWWELATLVAIMLLGHWIEMQSITQAHGALQELAKLLPEMALRLDKDDHVTEVDLSDLQVGEHLLIRPGASIPADGVVTSGKSSVNESMITGESRLIEKHEGDKLIAGTLNGEGSLRVEITGTGSDTALAGIMRLVEEAQNSRSHAQALADRAAYYLTLIAIATAGLTLLVWLVMGASLHFTITRMVTVLVIACPHALGLAVPLVVAISTTLAARHGLLVRDRRGLEEARNIDVVVFDKTGTLTLGQHRVIETVTSNTLSSHDALRLAAAVEHDSEHPIAKAIHSTAIEHGIDVPAAMNFQSTAGQGVQADVEGRQLRMGGPALVKQSGVIIPDELLRASERFGQSGLTTIYLIEGDHLLAVFAVADAIRPESNEAIAHLHKLGIQVAMLTGDSQPVADRVARELGIDTVFAQVMPGQKVEKICTLQNQGKRVAMVGDGVNDAPALVAADVGIAIGAGTDVAVEAGDVVLVRSDPRDIARIIKLSKATYRKMVENLWWATGYNIIAIPLAAGVLVNSGILLPPAVGAILMSISTVIVAVNAQLLRRVKL